MGLMIGGLGLLVGLMIDGWWVTILLLCEICD